MSNRIVVELHALKKSNGGGNAAGRWVWLARWSEDRFESQRNQTHWNKGFIYRVHNERVFYDESGSNLESRLQRIIVWSRK